MRLPRNKNDEEQSRSQPQFHPKTWTLTALVLLGLLNFVFQVDLGPGQFEALDAENDSSKRSETGRSDNNVTTTAMALPAEGIPQQQQPQPPQAIDASRPEEDLAVAHHNYAHEYTLPTDEMYAARFDWIGNRFLPPKHPDFGDAQSYYPNDMVRIFRNENTLFVGDSTMRQEYFTQWGIWKHHPDKAHPSPSETSAGDGTRTVVPPDDLDRNKNKGKFDNEYVYICPSRRVPAREGKFFRDLGQVPGTDATCFVGDDATRIHHHDQPPQGDWSRFGVPVSSSSNRTEAGGIAESGRGRFDYANAHCFSELTSVWLPRYAKDVISKEYTVVVISVALWDLFNKEECNYRIQDAANELDAEMLRELETLLDALKNLSSEELFVVWKVHGHAKEGMLEESKMVQERVRNWFAKERPPYMDVLDFAKAVEPRSLNEHRLPGYDIFQHWGVEGRLVGLDIAAHVVDLKQRRQRQQQRQQQQAAKQHAAAPNSSSGLD